MIIKILGILTLVLYMAIPIDGEHLGGPLIMFLIMIGLYKDFGLEMIWTILVLVAAVVLSLTIFKPRYNRDKVIVPLGLVILLKISVKIFFDAILVIVITVLIAGLHTGSLLPQL